jgi:hypothetical protein
MSESRACRGMGWVVLGIGLGCASVLWAQQGAAPPTPQKTPDAVERAFENLGLIAHPSLQALCGTDEPAPKKESEKGKWETFYSPLPPAELLGFYRDVLGEQGFEPTKSGGTWRRKLGDAGPNIELDILTVGEQLARCDTPVPGYAKSVVLLSIGMK